MPNHTCENLKQLRNSLMHLHKALLDFEKNQHEGKFGKIESTGKYFDLVLNNSSFSWLKQLSELVVGMDGILDNPKSQNEKNITDMIQYAKKALGISQQTLFSQKYLNAIQKDPTVALKHGKIKELTNNV